MNRSPSKKAHSRRWFIIYRKRITNGLEFCRACNTRRLPLTFDHLVPACDGGTARFDNVTILCATCNNSLKGPHRWPWLISLAQEEAEAPPNQRWSRVKSRAADA